MSSSPKPLSNAEEALFALLETQAGRANIYHALLDSLSPEARATLTANVLNQAQTENKGRSEFASKIGARTLDGPQKKVVELASLANFFEYRKGLLANAIPATKLAEMLGVSRQTIHDRAKSGQLLSIMDNNSLKFPAWQFDHQGPNGVVEGLAEIVAALDCSALAKISWLSSPNQVLAGLRPIDALRTMPLAEIVREARSVGVA